MIEFERGNRGGGIALRKDRMFPGIGSAAAGWLAILVLFMVSVPLSYRVLEERQIAARNARKVSAAGGDLLSVIGRRPSLAFGFRNFLCDVVWLKAVQVAGERRMSRGDYDRLFHLLGTTSDLDPRFKVPYLLGGIILGDSPSHVDEALRTLDRGRKNHPEDWRFPFYSGYIRYFSLGDPVGGGEELVEASRVPGSPPYLPLLAARMLSEGRKPETALAVLEEMMRQESDPGRREALLKRVGEVIVERDIQTLDHAVEEYRRRTGKLPENMEALFATGLIREIPKEPNGGRYVMTPDGKVHSDKVASRLKVFRNR